MTAQERQGRPLGVVVTAPAGPDSFLFPSPISQQDSLLEGKYILPVGRAAK